MTDIAAPVPASVPSHVPPERVLRFDFRNDPEIASDPWGYLAKMNDLPDIFFSPDLGGYWVITRYELIAEVFSNHELFTAKSLAIPKIENPMILIPNNFDPPEHTGYRRIFAQGLFSPRALATLEDDARRYTRILFDEFPRGHCEFVYDFAYKLPIDVFFTLMGFDHGRRNEAIEWIYDIFRGHTLEETWRGFERSNAFVSKWLDEQLANPEANQGRMFKALFASSVDGRPLTREELHSMTMMLFSGGLDTVTSQMTHIMQFMAQSPEHRTALVEKPDAIPVAVEEFLRRFGISHIGRMAAKDFEYYGVQFKAGDPVMASTPIAGLDARMFPDPLKVDFERGGRKGVKHLGFGAGVHLCPGAYFARTLIRVMLEEFLPLMPNLRIKAGATVVNQPGATMMLKELPLEWDV
jgi:cytochrome P450